MEAADAKAVPASKKRRLAIFLDGTWNVEDNNTNVWRLYSLCSAGGEANADQACFYTKGVGTDYGSKLKGGVLGMGFTTIIRQAYEWLVEHYRKEDDIFIFGFSRGAYAARSLAGLIARCGVPQAGSPIGIDEVYDRYKRGDEANTIRDLLRKYDGSNIGQFRLFEQWMIKYCVTAEVTMVGVWDTVGSLIGNYDYLETGLRLPIRRIYHALALDEHRAAFSPTLLTRNTYSDQATSLRSSPRPIGDVEQRWFVGAHANVGGGYASDPICQRPLAWIVEKAAALGLRISAAVDQDAEPWKYPVADSFRQFAYHLYQATRAFFPHYRTVGAADAHKGTKTTETVNETIDSSVFERWRQDSRYRPRNLARWAESHRINPKTVTTSVLAKNPEGPPAAD